MTPPAIASVPGERSIAFEGSGDGGTDLYKLDLETRRVSVLARTQQKDTDPVFSPKGDWFAFATADGQWGVVVISTQAQHETVRYASSRPRLGPALLATGEIVYIEAARKRPYAFGGFIWDEYDLWKLAAGPAEEAASVAQRRELRALEAGEAEPCVELRLRGGEDV